MYTLTKRPAPVAYPVERLAVSIREAGEMLGVSERTIYNMLRRGDIQSRKTGGRVLISSESLRAFVNGGEK